MYRIDVLFLLVDLNTSDEGLCCGFKGSVIGCGIILLLIVVHLK